MSEEMPAAAALSAPARAALRLGRVQVGWRGAAMGIAEVVPGVSGGTIALITGIYPLLVESLATFGVQSFSLLRRPRQFWAAHHLPFLLALALGMGLGIVVFGRLLHYLMQHYQPLVWSFFCGVIAMSVWVIGRERRRRDLLVWMPLGLAAGLCLLWLPVQIGSSASWYVFVAGAIAVCAWILPAVSGSYLLVVMGLYTQVLAAISTFDVAFLMTLAAGCATGILLFVRGVAWLLRRHYEALLALLCGFMLGSLPNIWPWQLPLAGGVAKWQALTTPSGFANSPEVAAMGGGVIGCLILFILGAWVLWRLSFVNAPAAGV